MQQQTRIVIEDLSFRYTPILEDVLENINLSLEKGKKRFIDEPLLSKEL